MNILIFASYYYPHIGGYEKNIHELAKRLVVNGHKVHVLTCNTDNTREVDVIDGVVICRMPCWNLLSKTYPVPKPFSKLFNQLFIGKATKCDMVITQTRFFILSLLGFKFAKLRKIPLIHVERGTCHSVTSNKFVSVVARFIDHTIGSLIVRYADANIGVSDAVQPFIRHLGGNSITIYNGIKPIAGVKDLDITKTIITYVGRLIEAKGVQDLIEAFKKICQQKYELWIVGKGSYEEKLKELAANYWNIKFLGEKTQSEVIEILKQTDIFINPSYSEGLPTSVLEASSLGLPIIATDVGGTSEIIEHMKSGYIYKAGDIDRLIIALSFLLRQRVKGKEMGMAAKETVKQKFCWDSIIKQYEAVFNRLDKSVLKYME